MGQGFSIATLTAGSAGIDVPELSDLVYEKTLGSARFMKSIRARHADGVVLVKVAVKPYPIDLRKIKKKIIQERKALADVPNALGYQRILETETNGYLVRQYLYNSLYDRMSTRPFLEDIEKKWLAFQLLCAVRDCHARDIFHGDIKTENALVTSWNWLYLTDFSASFKPTTLPEDDPAEFSYYFDTAGRRTCYLAPERFRAAGQAADPKAKLTWAMDIFSVGCVIAELFLEAPIFNLSQMFRYKKGDYDPTSLHLNKIADKDVRELIQSMIQLDPERRYSSEEYLSFWKGKVFPEYFYSFLHQYMGLITDPSSGRYPVSGATANLGEADDRIDRIFYDFDKISYFLGYGDEDRSTEKHRISRSSLTPIPVHLNIPNNEHLASRVGRKPVDDGTLIFLTLVVSSLRNTARATARIRACDILLAFAERLTDEAKLDRVLPYVFVLLNDKSELVKVAAIRTVTQVMALVNVISPVNAHIFPEYILPRMQSFVEGPGSKSSPFLRATYAACLGSLATTASRFLDMVATLRADGSLPAADPEAEDGSEEAPYHGLYDDAKSELSELFEGHTKALITDSDSSVRRAFLGSVPELCMFFGTAESKDIILSHLNTYLNDRDWMLKCAFFDTIVGIAAFLGEATLEEFILPLMVQALTDTEEFVVERVLRSLASMAELGLFQRSKTWELVEVVARFTVHPNIWIREAATMVIASSTIFLSSADNQCIVLPLIKPYLKTTIRDFSELSLLDALKKPLPRPVLDLALTWAIKVDRGTFWKPVQQMRTFSFGSTNTAIPTSGKDLTSKALSKVPKNEEDELWLNKLRNMGMGNDDEWKLLALREYIWRVAAARSRDTESSTPPVSEIVNLRFLGIMPQTVMFDENKAIEEPLRPIKSPGDGEGATHTIADALLDASMTIDDSLSRRKRSAYNTHKARVNSHNISNGSNIRQASLSPSPHTSTPNSPVSTSEGLQSKKPAATNGEQNGDDASSIGEAATSVNSRPSSVSLRPKSSAMSLLNRANTKSIPDTSMTSTNAFGKVEGPFTQETIHPPPLDLLKVKEEGPKPGGRFRANHNYGGNDPSILKMLDSMFVDNYPNDIVEFGPLVNPISKRKTIVRSNVQATDRPWRPEGILVATFSEHVGPINRVVPAPDHVFFITGGNDGNIKVWDTARLERNLAHRSRQTHRHASGAKITSLCFVENTRTFVSCAGDGSINVVKVDFNNTHGIIKYGKSRLLREYQLPADEYAVWSEHFRADGSSVLMIATNKSRILAIDLRTMDIIYVLENPVHHGTPTAFCIDRKRTWLLLGTSHGVLSLWDLRFKIRLKSWGVPGHTSIYRMCIHPFKGRGKWVCVSGGSGQGEVSIWDVEKTQCREVYRVGGNKDSPRGYEPWPVDEDRPEGMLGRFATALEPSSSGSADRSVRALAVGTDSLDDDNAKYGFLLTGGSDKKIRFWDLAHVEGSSVISGLDVEEAKPTFSSSHPTASLTLHTERLPRMTPSANNAAGAKGKVAGRPPRSTVISMQQQQLLRSHLDSITDITLLESPYGMTVSVDRSGIIYVFQ